jgi:hypothetical protein
MNMNEHQAVKAGYQFKHGVTFMTLTAQHLLNNMARTDICGFGTQGQFGGAFNRTKLNRCNYHCNKDFALIAFGMNSMGAHYNPA